MRDVDNGYILRYTHANVASFFFIFVYAQFNITNLFINLFNFFARYVLIHSDSARRMIGTRLLPNHHCSMSAVRQCAALNVKEEGRVDPLNMFVLLWLCPPKGLLHMHMHIHKHKHKLRFKNTHQPCCAEKEVIVSLSQLCLNSYDNTALNLIEAANFNSNNPQNVLKEESDAGSSFQEGSQNNNYKEKEEFLQWFTGFADAEGSFTISTPKETKEVHFRFKTFCGLFELKLAASIKFNAVLS